jgi:hypothetical protein
LPPRNRVSKPASSSCAANDFGLELGHRRAVAQPLLEEDAYRFSSIAGELGTQVLLPDVRELHM